MGGLMSEESVPRKELRRLVARHHLSKATLTLIAQATLPKIASDQRLDDGQLHSVHQAIEVLLLSGLRSDTEIAAGIREQREHGGKRWRDHFWRERLTLAAAAWEAQGRPKPAPPGQLATVPPIPPQPPSEIGEDTGKTLAA